jgi:S1-C subfamily serine protease
MLNKSKLIFILFLPFFLSCTTIDLQRKVEPPTKSYVKVFHSVKIIECLPEYKGMCPEGEFVSTGSGMIVDIIEDQTIVITAGHVCESEIDETRISKHSQKVSVVDYKGREHQAHVVKASHDNGMGSVDMCALWVPTLKEDGVDFSMFRPRTGQEVYYLGSPAGIYHPPVMPILVGLFSGDIDASNAMVSVPAIGGSSGSVILDMNNKMVGVLWAAHNFHHVTIMTNWHASALFLHEVIQMYTGKNNITLPLIKN